MNSLRAVSGPSFPTVHQAAGSIVTLLWGLAAWQSWNFQGLYQDGSSVLFDILLNPTFTVGPFSPRAHAVFLTESPLILALKLGVWDVRTLARIYSFGLYALPSAIYSVALLRARRDPVVLAVAIGAAAIVFMTTSFHIGCETGPGYATAMLIAVWLTTARRIDVADAMGLAMTAALSMRLYEHFVYLGPLLALMTVWEIARRPSRSQLATALYGLAALLLLCAAVIAYRSLNEYAGHEETRQYMNNVVGDVWDFRFNIQFNLLLVSATIFLIWAVLRPGDLVSRWPYLIAGLPIAAVMLSPILAIAERFVAPPYSWTQQASRTAAGPLAGVTVLILWLLASRFGMSLPVVVFLKRPPAARSFLLLATAMFLATIPWNVMLTVVYGRYLDVVRENIRAQSGPIERESSYLLLHPRLAHHDYFSPYLSLVMRSRPEDGIVLAPDTRAGDFDIASFPDLDPRFVWCD